jgi:ribosomal protein S17E
LNGYTGESRRWRALIAAYVTKIQERERQQAQTAPANE